MTEKTSNHGTSADSARPAHCKHTIWPLCRCTAVPAKKPKRRRTIVTSMYLTPAQHKALQALSARLDVPITRIVRAAIDRELAANAERP